MISALIINLDSSVDRWIFQKEQCERLGLVYERISACDKQSISDTQYALLANSWQRQLSKGELACFLSHYALWQRVIAENKPYLILEDDAVIHPQVVKVLAVIENKNNIDLLNVEARGRKLLVHKSAELICDDFSIKKVYQAKNGTAAYIVWPQGAKKLCQQFLHKKAALADAFISECADLKNMQLFPALAIQLDRADYYHVPLSDVAYLAMPTVLGTGRKETNKTFMQRMRRLKAQIKVGLRFLNVLRGAVYQVVPFNNDLGKLI